MNRPSSLVAAIVTRWWCHDAGARGNPLPPHPFRHPGRSEAKSLDPGAAARRRLLLADPNVAPGPLGPWSAALRAFARDDDVWVGGK
ncbi:hypothetical protein DDF65_01730 [Caulobacter radicis]|uniref:Uncharacterized protein n=1 Tax=Caulobacter radicis TaxID=2172650 RepID=A0A2T9JX12_9CAUL|nr:hypothetical protein DDF65_01730 [Caulobacter radicis]